MIKTTSHTALPMVFTFIQKRGFLRTCAAILSYHLISLSWLRLVKIAWILHHEPMEIFTFFTWVADPTFEKKQEPDPIIEKKNRIRIRSSRKENRILIRPLLKKSDLEKIIRPYFKIRILPRQPDLDSQLCIFHIFDIKLEYTSHSRNQRHKHGSCIRWQLKARCARM